MERRYHVNITVLSSIELVAFLNVKTGGYLKKPARLRKFKQRKIQGHFDLPFMWRNIPLVDWFLTFRKSIVTASSGSSSFVLPIFWIETVLSFETSESSHSASLRRNSHDFQIMDQSYENLKSLKAYGILEV